MRVFSIELEKANEQDLGKTCALEEFTQGRVSNSLAVHVLFMESQKKDKHNLGKAAGNAVGRRNIGACLLNLSSKWGQCGRFTVGYYCSSTDKERLIVWPPSVIIIYRGGEETHQKKQLKLIPGRRVRPGGVR